MQEIFSLKQEKERQKEELLLSGETVITLEQYQGCSERILGFSLLKEVADGLKDFLPIRVPEILIVGPQVLNETLQQNRLSESTKRIIIDNVSSLQRLDPLYPNFSIRHGIVVPGQPRARLDSWDNLSSPEESLEAISKMAASFIEQGFHRIQGSEFSLFVQQYADPPNLEGDVLPAGGEAFLHHIDLDGTALIEIQALYGDTAAVQMGMAADRFLVTFDPQRGVTNIESEIQHKLSTLLLARNETGKYSKALLPLEVQDKPAVNEEELLRLAYTVFFASKKMGKPTRIEFFRGPYIVDSLGSFYGPVIIEAVAYSSPLSFALSKEFFIKLLKENGLFEVWQSLKDVESEKELAVKFTQIQQGLKKLPSSWNDIRRTLRVNLLPSPTIKLAVRSNISIEDIGVFDERTGFFSFTGVFDSFLDVPLDRNFGEAILDCCRSAFSEKAAAVFLPDSQKETIEKTQKILDSYFPSVLIQEMVEATISGTGFYGEILGIRRPHIIIIEVQPGIAGVVGGDARPLLTLKFNTQTQNFESITLKENDEERSFYPQHSGSFFPEISNKFPSFSLPLARLLVDKVKKVSHDLGAPADIEWAVGQRSSNPEGPSELFLLQARVLRTRFG